MLWLVIALGIVDAGLLVWNLRLARGNRAISDLNDYLIEENVYLQGQADIDDEIWADYSHRFAPPTETPH